MTSVASVTIGDMPEEVLVNIFSMLDARNLCNVSKVCQQWYIISSDHLLWRPHSQKDLPQFKLPLFDRNWKEHYLQNIPSMHIRRIHFINHSDAIYSAWGKTICLWKKENAPDRFTRHVTDTDHQGAITAFDLHTEGLTKIMFTGASDNTVKVWNKSTGNFVFTLKQTLNEPEGPVTAISTISQGVLCSDVLGSVYFWGSSRNSTQYQFKEKIKAHGHRITHICATKSAMLTTFFTASVDKTIKVWRITSKGFEFMQEIMQDSAVTCMELLSQTDMLLVGYEDGTVKSWRKNGSKKFELCNSFNAHKGPVTSIHFCKNRRKIFTSGDGCVNTWNLPTDHSDKLILPEDSFSTDSPEEVVTSIQTTPDPRQNKLLQIYYISKRQMTILLKNSERKMITKYAIPITPPDPARPPIPFPWRYKAQFSIAK